MRQNVYANLRTSLVRPPDHHLTNVSQGNTTNSMILAHHCWPEPRKIRSTAPFTCLVTAWYRQGLFCCFVLLQTVAWNIQYHRLPNLIMRSYLWKYVKVKVKLWRYRPGVAHKLGRGILYSTMTAALEGDEWSAARPGRTLLPGKTRYPFYRRLGGPQDRSGRAENLVLTGIRSRTVQPVVSRYTDWATRPTV